MAHTEVYMPTLPDCDICKATLGDNVPAYADANLGKAGGWAYVCKAHFDYYCCFLGLGKGQKVIKVL